MKCMELKHYGHLMNLTYMTSNKYVDKYIDK